MSSDTDMTISRTKEIVNGVSTVSLTFTFNGNNTESKIITVVLNFKMLIRSAEEGRDKIGSVLSVFCSFFRSI